MRSFRLTALAVALLLALVFCPTNDAGRLQAQELTERQILVDLYNATDGPNWTDDRNWNTTADLSTWHGVDTNDQGRVAALSLRRNQLSGEIPPELGDLTSLNQLRLDGNQLSGEIPSELGKLTSLIFLNLSNNQLSGEIPPELGDLTSLNWLYLCGNQLTGKIPPELGDLTSLNYLDLSNNQLSGEIPPELGDLTRLRALHLYGNQLTGELPDLNALRGLTHLSLGGNDLGISWSTFDSGGALDLASESRWKNPNNDRSLWFLYLQESGLTGQIPDWIGANHTELRWLWLHDNALTGDVPRNLGNLRMLESLRLHGNMLTKRWESIAWWRELTDLTLPTDRFVGQGGTFFVVDDSLIFLKLALPSSVDPMQTHVRWFRDPYVPFENQLPPQTRTTLIVKIVRDLGANIVIELRDTRDDTVDGQQSIPAVVCLPVSSMNSSADAIEKPALLTYDGDAWRVLAPVDTPADFDPGAGNVAVCGTTLKEPTPPNTGAAVPSISWLLILVIFGTATILAGASLTKAFKKRGLM